MASLGEAISLQGRNNIAEQIGRMSFQANEADKNRGLKGGLTAAEKNKDQEKAILDLFKQKGEYHRLIVPKAQELATRTFQKLAEIKSSGTPYSSNQFAKLNTDVYNEFIDLQAQSDQLKAFDAQIKTTNYGKNFFGYGFSKFLPAYQNAKSLEDLQKLREQDPSIGNTMNFVLNEKGIPTVVPREAIPYQADLRSRVGALVPLPLKTSTKALDNAYGAREVKTVGIVPFREAEVEEIVKANPDLKGRNILSVEAVVESYMEENPSIIEQIADKANIPYNAVPGSGAPDDETIERVKEYLMGAAASYAKTKSSTQLVYAPKSSSTDLDSELTDDDYVSDGSPQTFRYGGTPVTYTSVKQVQFSGDKAKKTLPQDAKLTSVDTGQAPDGEIPNAELSSMVVLPYKNIGGVKRPAKDGSAKDGYHVFLLFTTPTKSVYADADAYRPAAVVTWTKGSMADVKRQMAILEKVAAETK